MSSHPRFPWINVPNAITVVRILMVPLFIWWLLLFDQKSDPMRWAATAVFVIAIATDGVDGAIARRKNLITNLGKLLDPIADKALIGGGLVVLSMLGEIPWWVTIAIMVREIGITVYRLVVVKKRVIAASAGGKLKTILQGSLLGVMISPLDSYWVFDLGSQWLFWLEQSVLYLTLTITLYTGVQYVVAATRSPKA